MGILIEFVGLPGAGKTTLARKVAQEIRVSNQLVITRSTELADDSWSVVRHVIRARYVLSSALREPKMFLASARLIHEDGQPNIISFAKVCWNLWWVLGGYGWLARNRGGVTVVDQGIMQAIWSVRLSALRSVADWAGFLRDFPMIDGIVIVDCSLGTAQQRLNMRIGNTSRLGCVTSRDRIWQVAQRAYAQAAREALAVAPVLRVTNDVGEDSYSGVSDILSWFESVYDIGRSS